jgi:lysophospholipase L1-like esterase
MHSASQPHPEPARFSLAVLGDSLAYGMGASKEELSLARRLYSQLRGQRPGSTYANYAVPYSTLGDVLRHQVPLLRGTQADLVLLIAGANDLRYTRDVLVIARRFRHLLQAIHETAPLATVVAAGMPDVTCTIAVPRVLKPGIARLCSRINETMRRIVCEFGDEFIDLFAYTNAPLKPDEIAYLCEDGYHPSDAGYAELAERAYPALAKRLYVSDSSSSRSNLSTSS